MDRDTLLLIAFALLFAAGTVLGVGGVVLCRRDRSAPQEKSPAGGTAPDGEPSDEAEGDAPSSREGDTGNDPASAPQGGAEVGP